MDMLLRLLFYSGLFFLILAGLISCGSGSEDEYKGEVKYAGGHLKNGKEFIVISYSEDEAEDRLDNQADAHFYYVRAYTIDPKTGKAVHQTEYDVSEFGGDFIGATDKYLFYQSSEGIFAIDVFQSGKVITPPQVLKMIGRINPKLKGRIVSLKINSEEKFVVQEQHADEYILDPKTLKAMAKTEENTYGREYKMGITKARYCPLCFESTSYDTFLLNDTVSIYLKSQQGESQTTKFLSIGMDYPTTKKYGAFEQVDKTPFINGYPIGAKDSTVYLTYLTDLSKNGTYQLAAYDWGNHKFLWSKKLNNLYQPNEFGNYQTAWNNDGTAFLLWGTDVVSYIDAKTGKKLWTF